MSHRFNCLSFRPNVNSDNEITILSRQIPIATITHEEGQRDKLIDITFLKPEFYTLFADRVLLKKYGSVINCTVIKVVCPPEHNGFYEDLGCEETNQMVGYKNILQFTYRDNKLSVL